LTQTRAAASVEINRKIFQLEKLGMRVNVMLSAVFHQFHIVNMKDKFIMKAHVNATVQKRQVAQLAICSVLRVDVNVLLYVKKMILVAVKVKSSVMRFVNVNAKKVRISLCKS
jgi:hypothetical protein